MNGNNTAIPAAERNRRGALRNPPATLAQRLRAAVVGDPDGSKARAASARSTAAEPLTTAARLDRYRRQGKHRAITPAQRRRLLKKARSYPERVEVGI